MGKICKHKKNRKRNEKKSDKKQFRGLVNSNFLKKKVLKNLKKQQKQNRKKIIVESTNKNRRSKSISCVDADKKNFKIKTVVNNNLPTEKKCSTIPDKKNTKKNISPVNYFTEETERAIVQYKQSDDQSFRDRIFREKIETPFRKLIENIFHRFKFCYFLDSPDKVQQEVLSHLVSNIEKYDPEVSSKLFSNKKCRAFSYFSVMARNWLMSVNNLTYKNYQKNLPITEIHKDGDDESIHFVQLQYTDPVHREVENEEFIQMVIQYWNKNKYKVFSKFRDIQIVDSVLELLEKRSVVEETNKKALYLYIKNMVTFECKTQHITKVLSKMQKHYNIIKKCYLSGGSINDIILV